MVNFNTDLCTGCGQCKKNCCTHAIVQNEDGTLRCNPTFCFSCGQCVAICPVGAVSMPELEAPIDYSPAAFDISPENLLNSMRFRRSVRSFTGTKIPREKLALLLEAGRCAPTAKNAQDVRFVVLDKEFEPLRAKIWASFAREAERQGQKLLLRRYQHYLAHPEKPDALFYGATQMIAVTATHPVDGAIAMANMELMAHALGLGGFYCGFVARAIQADGELRSYFGITEDRQLISCLVLGDPAVCFRRTAPRNPAQAEWR